MKIVTQECRMEVKTGYLFYLWKGNEGEKSNLSCLLQMRLCYFYIKHAQKIINCTATSGYKTTNPAHSVLSDMLMYPNNYYRNNE